MMEPAQAAAGGVDGEVPRMSEPGGSGRTEPVRSRPAAPLTAPGPPPEDPAGPLYGARYGDPAYEAAFGARPASNAPGGSNHTAAGSNAAATGQPPGGPPGPVTGQLTYRPGVVTLRPLSIGDLLDGAVRTIRLRPGLFLGAGAAAVILGTLIRAVIDVLVGVTIVAPDGNVVRITPSVAVLPAVGALLAGVLSVPTAQAVLGRSLDWPRLRAMLRPRWTALLGYVALAGVACLVPALLLWFALGGRDAQQGDLMLAMGAIAVVVGLVRLPFVAAPAAIVLEGAGPWRALRRSMTLVRGYVGRTLGVSLLAWLIVSLVSVALITPLAVAASIVSSTSGFTLGDGPLEPLVTTLFGLLTSVLTLPFEATLRSLYYVDLRVRAEGLDVLLLDEARRGERR